MEVVKIDEGEASFFYLLLIKFSQTDQPDSLGIYSHLSRRYKLLEECFERSVFPTFSHLMEFKFLSTVASGLLSWGDLIFNIQMCELILG